MKNTLIQCVRGAGDLLLKNFGRIDRVTRKGNLSDVVTAADLASEKLICKIIRQRHPEHNLLGEEYGFQNNGSDTTWVIDPLDGTSNFAAGLPWFGVMIAVLRNNEVVLAAMYLPVTDTLYFSERGKGVFRNNRRIGLTHKHELGDSLCTYGMDPGATAAQLQKQGRMMTLLVTSTRNVRLTNCLLDFCNTLDGHIGACINQSCKIWDIAPACLLFYEAGGRFTDLHGGRIKLDLDAKSFSRNYAVIGGSPRLHKQVVALALKAGL
jgi:myo-inositol-1(or 4)-monophosphatase